VVVGDERVGKTQLLNRYVYNSFQPAYKETIGADFMSKSDVPPGSESLTQLWVFLLNFIKKIRLSQAFIQGYCGPGAI